MTESGVIDMVETGPAHFEPRPTPQEVFQKKPQESELAPLDQYRKLGLELSLLVNTSAGRKKIEEIRSRAETACKQTYPIPTSADLPRLGVGQHDTSDAARQRLPEILRRENQERINSRTNTIMSGGTMTNLEEKNYFNFESNMLQQERDNAKTEDWNLRRRIGAALSHLDYLSSIPAGEIPEIPEAFRPGTNRLGFEHLNINQVSSTFAGGWGSVISTDV